MPSVHTPYERKVLCRARRRAGKRVYQIELDTDELCEELIATDRLQETDRGNHAAVARALGRAVEFLIFGKN